MTELRVLSLHRISIMVIAKLNKKKTFHVPFKLLIRFSNSRIPIFQGRSQVTVYHSSVSSSKSCQRLPLHFIQMLPLYFLHSFRLNLNPFLWPQKDQINSNNTISVRQQHSFKMSEF
jgi:hypothetical protein